MAATSLGSPAKQRMVEYLQRVNDVLRDTPMDGRYWICGGMLLGWAREGDLLEHDALDADFAYHWDDEEHLQATFPALVAAGFEPHARYPGAFAPEATEWVFTAGDARLEFFRFGVQGDRFRWSNYFGHGLEHGVEQICELPAQPLEHLRFLDRDWLKVRDHELELEGLYGDWRTPDPDWDYSEGRAVVERRPWDKSSYSLKPC